jgi:hypothetical protein
MVNVYVWGFGSNGFVTKAHPFPMDGHYRTDIINGVDYLRSNLVMPLVLCTNRKINYRLINSQVVILPYIILAARLNLTSGGRPIVTAH